MAYEYEPPVHEIAMALGGRVANDFRIVDRKTSDLLAAFADLEPKQVDPDAPLRLADAIAIAFPNGGPTPEALRREACAGRLEIWRVGGKDFTSINAIKRMLESCRAKAVAPDCGSDRRDATPKERLSSTRTLRH